MNSNNGFFTKVANGIKRAVDFVINVLLFIPRLVLKGFKKLMGRAEEAAEEFDEDAEEETDGESAKSAEPGEAKKEENFAESATVEEASEEVVVEDKKEVDSENKAEEASEEVVAEGKKDDEPEQKSSEQTAEPKDDSEKEEKEVDSENKAEEASEEVVAEGKKDDEVIAAASEPDKEIVKAEVVDTETGTVIDTVDTTISEDGKEKKNHEDKVAKEENIKQAKEKVALPEEERKLNNIMSEAINNLRGDMLNGYKGYFSAHAHDFAKSFLNVIGFKSGKVHDDENSDQFYYNMIDQMQNGKIVIKNNNNKTSQTIEIDTELGKMLRNAIDNIPIFFDYDMDNIFERFEKCFYNFIRGAYDIVQSNNGEIHKADAAGAAA